MPLAFASFAGVSSTTVKAEAICYAANRFVGFVGLDSVKLTGTGSSKMDSWDSGQGAYSPTLAQSNAAVASNGDIQTGGNITVKGDAHPGIGRTVSCNGGSSVTGSKEPLTFVLSFPMPVAGSAATTNNNGSIPSTYYNASTKAFNLNTAINLSGGTYYFSSFTIGTSGKITFSGPATIFVYGNISMQGSVVPSGNSPSNLKIRVTATGTSVVIKSTAAFSADVYCPGSDLSVSGSANYYGGYIGKTLTFAGSASLHYDESLGTTGMYGGVSMVR